MMDDDFPTQSRSVAVGVECSLDHQRRFARQKVLGPVVIADVAAIDDSEIAIFRDDYIPGSELTVAESLVPAQFRYHPRKFVHEEVIQIRHFHGGEVKLQYWSGQAEFVLVLLHFLFDRGAGFIDTQ